jgi:hypothetical protein
VETAETLTLELETLQLRIQSIDSQIDALKQPDRKASRTSEDILDQFMASNTATKDEQVTVPHPPAGAVADE